MNLVGKIFTVFVFLMSVVFATFALAVYAGQKNWKLVADNTDPAHPKGLAQQLQEKNAENAKLVEKKRALEDERKTEKDRMVKRLGQLETDNQRLAKENNSDNKKIDDLEAALRAAVGALNKTEEELKSSRGLTAQLREDIKTAETDRDTSFKKVVALTDELHNNVTEVLRLQTMNRSLVEQVAAANECIRYFGINLKTYKDKEPPPLEGVVTDASQPEFVTVSLGSRRRPEERPPALHRPRHLDLRGPRRRVEDRARQGHLPHRLEVGCKAHAEGDRVFSKLPAE